MSAEPPTHGCGRNIERLHEQLAAFASDARERTILTWLIAYERAKLEHSVSEQGAAKASNSAASQSDAFPKARLDGRPRRKLRRRRATRSGGLGRPKIEVRTAD